jgi:ubiquinone/menaquinone biosynthesis C-methylase UbiE
MALHPLSARFADVAGVYELGRPEYAPAVVGAIAAELRIPADATVLDLAAGTGKLTRALVAFGLDVMAVEPQAPLREMLGERVGAERVRDGLAESIPLPDGSMAAVTVADAFHWFDQAAAVREIERVLRPGGGLAVIFTAPDWQGASWAEEVGNLMMELRPQHPGFDGPPWQDAVRAAGRWTEPREIRVTATQPAGAERLLAYIASVSWVAALAENEHAETLARIEALIAAGETPDEIPVQATIGLTSLA